jgi:hypothetical protein
MKIRTWIKDWINAAQPERAEAAGGRRRGAGGILTVLLLATLVLAGCAGKSALPVFCAEQRINLAMDMFDRAKEHLAIHYQQRTDSTLGLAYRASQDAVTLARASRRCRDFDRVLRRQAINLIRTNLLFQKLVVSNMRDQDPGVVIDIYGPGYREIFKNDIQ